MRIFALILAAGLAFAQTSRYPGGLDDDSTLFVVKDNVQTTLSAAMGTSDTVAVVASATGFVPNMIATICDTSTNTGKCTAWEHMLVTSIAGNVLTVTRAFAGTTVRTHSSGRLVSVLIDSAHQKVLKDSVVAMETALGPNLVNFPKSPFVVALQYSFAPIVSGAGVTVAGGNIVIGNNTLTFATVPAGVNGTDIGHFLLISGGTGTAEGCRISGGSGTAGQANGQIIMSCAQTHSGAWAVASGSGGIQEAIVSLGPTVGSFDALGTGGGMVYAGCGTYDVYGGPILLPSNVALIGNPDCTTLRSQGVTVLATKPGSFHVAVQQITINLNGKNNIGGLDVNSTSSSTFRDIRIMGGTPSTGSIGLWVRASANGVPNNSTFNLFDHFQIEIGPDRPVVLQGMPDGEVNGGVVTLSTFRLFRIAAQGPRFVDLVQACDTNFFYDFDISSSTPNSVGFFFNSGSPTVQNGASGIKIQNLICEGQAATSQCLVLFATSENVINSVRSYWDQPYFFSPNAKTTTITNVVTGIPAVLIPAVQTMGAPVASATTVTLADTIFHMTGTAAISGITAGPVLNATATCITVIPDGAWSLVLGGNIAAASTAVVGKAMRLCFDGVTSKWYPSY